MSAPRYFCRAQHEMYRDDDHGGWVGVHDYEKLEARVKALEAVVDDMIELSLHARLGHVGDGSIRSPQIAVTTIERWRAVRDARV